MDKFKKKMKIRQNSSHRTNCEGENREKPFTPGWKKQLTSEETLPIKVGGSIVKYFVQTEKVRDECDEVRHESERIDREETISSFPCSSISSLSKCDHHGIVNRRKFGSMNEAKSYIGFICTKITANPLKSLSPRRKTDDLHDREYPRVSDLITFLTHGDIQVAELTMLSLLLVFKDICPSYRIRLEDNEAQLKKHTKVGRDLDQTLLECYHKYIHFLQLKVDMGLGNVKKNITLWDQTTLFGLSAYRCLCELFRNLHHFNFRSILLSSVMTRGSQPTERIMRICVDCIDYILKNDTDGEVTLEIVKQISQNLAALNYDVDEYYIRILDKVKLSTHVKEFEAIRKEAKTSRRKRKRAKDNIELSLLESEIYSKTSQRRFQLDCLHEICLIYFRIIKRKVSFKMLSIALEGMSKISHLVNIDTIEGLIIMLKKYLSMCFMMPTLVRLNCILCGLKTLSGPGIELHIDDHVFIDALYTVLTYIGAEFESWNLVLSCIEFALFRRREIRPHVIAAFIRQLFFVATQMEPSKAVVVLSVVYSLLVRYSSSRNRISALMPAMFSGSFNVDEVRVDMAMDNFFFDNDAAKVYVDGVNCGDASWSLSLLRLHPDTRYEQIVSNVFSMDLIPVPFQSMMANVDSENIIVKNIDNAFKQMYEK